MLRQEKQDEAIRNTRQTEEVVVTETESQRNVLRERGSSFLDVYIYGKSEIGSDVYRCLCVKRRSYRFRWTQGPLKGQL